MLGSLGRMNRIDPSHETKPETEHGQKHARRQSELRRRPRRITQLTPLRPACSVGSPGTWINRHRPQTEPASTPCDPGPCSNGIAPWIKLLQVASARGQHEWRATAIAHATHPERSPQGRVRHRHLRGQPGRQEWQGPRMINALPQHLTQGRQVGVEVRYCHVLSTHLTACH